MSGWVPSGASPFDHAVQSPLSGMHVIKITSKITTETQPGSVTRAVEVERRTVDGVL